MMNPDEILEIMDENNSPLGFSKKRSDVHRDNLEWHRVTAIWVVNDEKEILCQKANVLKDIILKDKWFSIFGGHLQPGQSYESNAIEELEEEIGLKVTSSKLNFIESRMNEEYKHHITVYVVWWNGDLDDLVFNDGEVLEVKWFTIEELYKMKETGKLENSIREKVIEFIRNN